MNPAAALNRRLGIQARYLDNTGFPTAAPAATVRGLWQALLPETGADDPRSLLAALDYEAAARILDPVIVEQAGSARLEVRLRLRSGARRLRWDLEVEDGGRRRGERRAKDGKGVLHLPRDLPPGYHHLTVGWIGGKAGETRADIILTPPRAYLPPALAGRERGWGLAAQLYALRSQHNWGIGDFSDLGEILERGAGTGAACVGVNPLHALFEDEPERASPYSPCSRLFLNTLYIDAAAVPDFMECETARRLLCDAGFAGRLADARRAPLVDYAAVAQLKHEALRLAYEHFRRHHLAKRGDSRGAAFRAYQAQGGTKLRCFAAFQALRAHFAASWRDWPDAYRRPESPAVRRFSAEHAEAIELFEYLQWQAQAQLASAAQRGRAAGMPVGIYRDLAVGFDPDGADAWAGQSFSALDWSIGAPPDAWNMKGQMWGMPPPTPRALRNAGYQPLIEVLRANMRHAGALRIDHVLGLKRLFWIPLSAGPTAGVYVNYPFDEMLGIVALESQRNRCLVIGEDLGTVPAGFSAALHRRGILSYRLLYFMRAQSGAFIRPSAWPRDELAQVSTHDLPTLAGFWGGRDIETKRDLSLFPDRAAEEGERKSRPAVLRDLRRALAREGLGTRGNEVPTVQVHRFLARSRSRLVLAQLEDLVGAADQINMPGTVDQHPNWRRKLPRDLDTLFVDTRAQALLSAIGEERPAPRISAGHGPGLPPLTATYRLQLQASFGFEAAAEVLPYLRELGISHVYLSPILEAQAGSTHGYDGTSYERLNPDLGPPESFDRLVARLRELGMGLILDFVPNHMGIGKARNCWWLDLLEWGKRSSTAEVFDVDWNPPWPELKGKILVPFLGDDCEKVAARRELRLRFDREAGRFDIWYFDHRFPIRPPDYAEIIRRTLADHARNDDGAEIAALRRLAREFAELDGTAATGNKKAADLQTVLARFARRSAKICRLLETPAAPDGLLVRQHYRLAHWRLAATRANYRRFFDIATLIGVRMDKPAVFDRCHDFIGRLIAEGKLNGLRLDHVDGLKDPGGYCRRLRRFVERKAGRGRPFYLAVEKILGAEETLRREWPVQGTTGYEFIALLNNLFVDRGGAAPLQRICDSFAGRRLRLGAILRKAKGQVIDLSFGADLDRLAVLFQRLAKESGAEDDFAALRDALRRIAVSFPVYRSYVDARGGSAEDRRLIGRAVGVAARDAGTSHRRVYAFLKRCLAGEARAGRTAAAEAAMQFQQFTAPIMAKGLEDTAFYRYPRLLSLNEVGGDPSRFGAPPAELHRRLAARRRLWPQALLATATHDTKRGEDSRARLNVLSETPERWERKVRAWARRNRPLRRTANGAPAPLPRDEYFLYQALVGAWPLALLDPPAADGPPLDALAQRMKAYFIKALREAKQATSWVEPDRGYEQACIDFLEGLLDPSRSQHFIDDLAGFVREIAWFGAMNSLGQTLLKLTAPGVPDIYQGCELWDLSLVDPDNRRPVDFALRQGMLCRAKPIEALIETWPDGRLKLHLIAAVLRFRRRLPALFTRGSYEPLSARGAAASHLFAFCRRDGERTVIVATARLLARLTGQRRGRPAIAAASADAWSASHLRLPAGMPRSYREIITGRAVQADGDRRLALRELFDPLPVAMLADLGADA